MRVRSSSIEGLKGRGLWDEDGLLVIIAGTQGLDAEVEAGVLVRWSLAPSVPRHLVDVDAVEDGRESEARLVPMLGGAESRLPPHGAFLQELVSLPARGAECGRIGQLLIATKNHDAHPLIAIRPLINLQADERIGAHPLDLLSECGEPVEMLSIVREVDWKNIGLVVACARQSTETNAL